VQKFTILQIVFYIKISFRNLSKPRGVNTTNADRTMTAQSEKSICNKPRLTALHAGIVLTPPLVSDQEVDEIINAYISRHGSTTGEVYLRGHFRALGYNIQRKRIRESLNRVDPRNTALRWGALVSRRKYFVPWTNSLWHMDGHHSLIRWGFVNYPWMY
jgi:hypothetical protein